MTLPWERANCSVCPSCRSCILSLGAYASLLFGFDGGVEVAGRGECGDRKVRGIRR